MLFAMVVDFEEISEAIALPVIIGTLPGVKRRTVCQSIRIYKVTIGNERGLVYRLKLINVVGFYYIKIYQNI